MPNFTHLGQNISDWRTLKRGEEIELHTPRQSTVRGMIDDYTFDHEILWLRPHNGTNRTMIHRQDGWEIRVIRRPAVNND